jgi:antirestriction protein ArdC
MATKKYDPKTYVAKPKPTLNEIKDRVLENVLNGLENGTATWQKSWENGGGFGFPVKVSDMTQYRGTNILLLSFNDFTSPIWGTFKAFSDKKCQIKKGSKATQVVFWNTLYKDKDGKLVYNPTEDQKAILEKIPYLQTDNVFNLDQCEDGEAKLKVLDRFNKKYPKREFSEKVIPSDIQVIIDATKAVINYGGDRAFYTPDRIQMPLTNSFKTIEDAISTIFHELAHWTGAKHRLNRDGIVNFDRHGSHKYSLEELIAEIFAQMMCVYLGVNTKSLVDNSTAYIVGWTKSLKDPENKDWVYQAAKEAQKIFDFIVPKIVGDSE